MRRATIGWREDSALQFGHADDQRGANEAELQMSWRVGLVGISGCRAVEPL